MTAVHIAYSRTRAVFGGIMTVSLMVAGFFLIFFSAPRVPGISEVSGVEIAHADAPDSIDIPPVDFAYYDPGCGCGCGCGF